MTFSDDTKRPVLNEAPVKFLGEDAAVRLPLSGELRAGGGLLSKPLSETARLLLAFLLFALPIAAALPMIIAMGQRNAEPEIAQIGPAAFPPLADAAQPRVISVVGYCGDVVSALNSMGATVGDFERWAAGIPGTTLRRVKYMSADKQRKVASTALFIRRSNSRIEPKTAWREASALVHYSVKYGVPELLATAVAHAESTFDPGAVSSAGAAGVMQVMWRIHSNLLQANGIVGESGKSPLGDPEKAIAAGCLLLSRYLKACGSVAAAMERYYGGRSASYQNKITRNIASIAEHRSELYANSAASGNITR